MKKKILSLIVSVAMVMTVFAGMTVTASADDIAATTAFTVYLQGEDGTLTAEKEYTAEQFAALAETGSIGGFYYKGDVWNGITSNQYVTVETLLADAGINKDFVAALYATEVKDKYRLVLAERAYAKELLAKDVKENDAKYEEYAKLTKEEQEQKLKDEPKTPTDYYFADSKIQAKYAKDVYSEFEAIIVPFTSKRQAEIALTQINVTVKDGVWTDGTNALSALQVFEKFIELYKVVYGYKVTGELNKDSEEFKFNEGDLNSNILKVVKDKLETYTEDSKNEAPKRYTPNALEIGSGNEAIYVLKLKEELATSYEDLDEAGKKAQREKYTDALIDETVTSNYVSVKMGLLRKEQNIVIYDSVVENLYSNAMSKLSVTYDKTKLESAEYVAETTDIKVTPKDLYEAMLKYQGAAIVMDKLVEKRALYNKNFNKYYDMSTNKWLNNNKKTEITDLIEAEKKNFKNGNYKEYGYDPSQMSWTLFIKSLYLS